MYLREQSKVSIRRYKMILTEASNFSLTFFTNPNENRNKNQYKTNSKTMLSDLISIIILIKVIVNYDRR